jgi:hypothetical protein
MLHNAVHSGLNYYNSLIPSKYKGMILLILINKENGKKTYRVFSTEQDAIDEYNLNKEYYGGQMFLLGDINEAVAVSKIY